MKGTRLELIELIELGYDYEPLMNKAISYYSSGMVETRSDCSMF